ncbi:MAG TPA: phosphopantetheine-binding protein, partial [Candidatus Limnocylindrales bacterium]|nr:phosphopantetheine-binding protein [Candidatus Limnocylindrales bacterium]
VEVGEVESALLDHPGVCEAAVVGRPVDDGGMRLLGYAVARRDAALSARDLRAFLRDRLPDYRSRECSWSSARSRSCPTARWTARRCRTRRPTAPARRRRSPTPWRPSSWKCFADVLHVGEVGVHDDFFALGGDSLQAGQIASRLRERLAVDVPLATILERPTASELAVAVVDVMAHSGDPTGLSATLLAVERTARDQTARLL